MKNINCLATAMLFACASAYASPINFSQCPAVGSDTSGCEFLITVTSVAGGNATAFTVSASSPDLGPYDGSDDTLVGVQNNSSAILTALALSSPANIFGFEDDGACSGSFGAIPGCTGATDPSGYAPAGVSFSGVNAAQTAGTVNFSPGLAAGGSGWFSLEDTLTASQIQPGNVSSVPEPASMLLVGIGLIGMSVFVRRHVS